MAPVSTTVPSDIRDPGLAPGGVMRVEWADRQMPVLAAIRERFSAERPLADLRVSACLHVTSETANLMRTLKAGGADVLLCASNPLSTQDEVAAALVAEYGIAVYAVHGEPNDIYYGHIGAAVDHRPHITMDDGCDVVSTLHKEHQDMLGDVLAGTEETTMGHPSRAMEQRRRLKLPVIAVNDAQTKHFFDNRYGTGQITLDGHHPRDRHAARRPRFVVCGYGWCGKGVARGPGAWARTSSSPRSTRSALRGRDGRLPGHGDRRGGASRRPLHHRHRQHPRHPRRALPEMKDGAMICNSGHFDVELDLAAWRAVPVINERVREFVDEYVMTDGRRLYVLGEGRLINLAAAEGHPASVMDMSFATQALAAD